MKHLILFILCLSVIFTHCVCSSDSSMKQGIPDLKLFLQPPNSAPNEIVLQLVVSNVGEFPLVIPRLRKGLLEQYGEWWGWDILLRNQDGEPFNYMAFRDPPLKKKALVKLKPKENFTVAVHVVADAKWDNLSHEDYGKPLPEGVYEAVVSLHLNDDLLPDNLKNTVWNGRKESNTVKLVIAREKQDQTSKEGDEDEQK